MTELLKRWAELEPAWCRVDDERAGVMTDVGTPLERPRFEAQFHRLGQYEPYIFASVIEAIEARGWFWNVGTTLQEPVQAYVQSPERTFRPVRAETPAAALLGAYLAALEAEADQ